MGKILALSLFWFKQANEQTNKKNKHKILIKRKKMFQNSRITSKSKQQQTKDEPNELKNCLGLVVDMK